MIQHDLARHRLTAECQAVVKWPTIGQGRNGRADPPARQRHGPCRHPSDGCGTIVASRSSATPALGWRGWRHLYTSDGSTVSCRRHVSPAAKHVGHGPTTERTACAPATAPWPVPIGKGICCGCVPLFKIAHRARPSCRHDAWSPP